MFGSKAFCPVENVIDYFENLKDFINKNNVIEEFPLLFEYFEDISSVV